MGLDFAAVLLPGEMMVGLGRLIEFVFRSRKKWQRESFQQKQMALSQEHTKGDMPTSRVLISRDSDIARGKLASLCRLFY